MGHGCRVVPHLGSNTKTERGQALQDGARLNGMHDHRHVVKGNRPLDHVHRPFLGGLFLVLVLVLLFGLFGLVIWRLTRARSAGASNNVKR